MAFTEWELRRGTAKQYDARILICDDDPAFLDAVDRQVRCFFEKRSITPSISRFTSPMTIPEAALEACDLAFFDIDFDMDDTNGIDAARRLRQVNSRALIFFVTNYIDYAPAGYEVQAFRYVLKRDMAQVLERYLLQAMDQFAERQESLRLQGRDGAVELPLEQITYIEVMDHSASVHTRDAAYGLNTTLSSLENGLREHGFLRIHKSFLVNMRHIRKFRSRECLLSEGTVLAVSEKNYSQQKQRFLLWKGLE